MNKKQPIDFPATFDSNESLDNNFLLNITKLFRLIDLSTNGRGTKLKFSNKLR